MTSPSIDAVSAPETLLDLAELRRRLIEKNVTVVGDLKASLITGGRSNLTFKVTDDHQGWVVRRPPVAGLTPSAHDVGREYRVIDALQGTAVPVAATVGAFAQAQPPFTVVEFVPGRVLRTQEDLTALSDEDLKSVHRELIRVLVALHEVDYASVGLAELGRPDGFVARQVKRWRQQWDHVATRELDDVDRLYLKLADRVPAQSGASIVHGDYRIDNTLVAQDDPATMLALVDWEMATLGDPLTDVAMLCVYQDPEFDHVAGEPAASTSTRWPSIDTVAQDYAEFSGRDLGDFNFYLGLGYFKIAVIAEGIAARQLAGAGSGPGFETAGLSVPGFIAAGLTALAK